MIEILFIAHNRLRFTQASVEALIANTDWSKVLLIRVHDDGSEDGTQEYLASVKWPVPREFRFNRLGGPVAVMNRFVAERRPDLFVKVDNDVLLPPGWLPECLDVMERSPELDLLGIECTNDFPVAPSTRRGYDPAPHIGGVGLIRGRIFRYGLPHADGRQGWTQFQHRFWDEIKKGWLAPALPVCLLDHLPMEPWFSLSEQYIDKGWQRRGWGETKEQQYYGEKSSRLWEWWAGAKQETAA